MGLCFGCFDGGNKRMTKEEERLASEEARARAAEAAQKKQEQQGEAKQPETVKEPENSNNGEAFVKV
ncbi:hypothetical protein AAZX31_06G043300 [Glycine max]|uniref:Small VCP/p97-interacting protein n=2 Tax=Glycine subgen. Soja TaxID=1462606 RepID=K7KT39_SOYBN|nr:hypothetical protein JHK86_014401 [Glycine max]KHN45142.1 hypothetical protein glysoja_031370 [Glycine soja]KAH1124177.1 hypothetical protein GYH30_014085 [Glycine max]KRH52098.1 hypothetical protein GLYMA_06G046700v4 [Glycine max]RZC05815.1 hypothetical protein D0Y65_013743 [Glycine soja]